MNTKLRSLIVAVLFLLAGSEAFGQQIFWTESDRIMIGTLTPGGIVNPTIFIPGLNGPHDITLDISDERIFYTTEGGEDIIAASIYDGTYQSTVITTGGMVGINDIAYSGSDMIYATIGQEGDGVYRIPANNNDGSGSFGMSIGGNGNATYLGIEVNDATGRVFMVNTDANIIYNSDLLDTNAGSVVALTDMEYLTVDRLNNKLYFTRLAPGTPPRQNHVYSVNFDGTGLSTPIIVGPGIITSIQVYPQFDKIYYVKDGVVYQMNMNGTSPSPLPGLTGVHDIAIQADLSSPVFTSLAPANSATNVPTSTTQLRIFFDEMIQPIMLPAVNANDRIVLRQDGSVIGTFDRDVANISVSGTVATINFSPAPLVVGKTYDVVVGSNVFQDNSGNKFVGIASGGWTFTTPCGPLIPGVATGGGTICAGGDPAIITGGTASGGDGTFTYKWQSSASAGGPFADIPTATGADYDPPVITATTYYQRVVNSINCSLSATGNVIAITVNPNIVPATISGTQTICAGSDPTILSGPVPTGGNGSYTYQWEVSTISATTGFSPISSGQNYDPPVIVAATPPAVYYRRVDSSPPCPAAITNAITITVNLDVNPGIPSGSQSVCAGGDPTLITGGSASGGNGTFTYQWELATASSTGPFTPIGIAGNGINYDPPVGINNTTYYRRIVTSPTCPPKPSSPVPVTVTAPPTITTQPTPQQACANGTAIFNVSSTGGGVTYQWQADGPTGFLNISNGSIYSGVTSNQLTVLNVIGLNGFRYRCIVTLATCTATSNIVPLTVDPPPVATDPNPAAMCEDSPGSNSAIIDLTTFSAAVTGGQANRNIAWFFDSALGSPVPTPSSTRVSNGVSLYILVTNTTTSCTAKNKTTFTVMPTPAAVATPPNVTLCSGANAIIALSGATSFTWKVSANASVSGAVAGSASSINQNLTNSASSQQQINYLVTPSTNGCIGAELVVPVKIDPAPTAFNVTGGGSFCEGGVGVPVGIVNSQSGVSYQLLLNGQAVNTSIISPGGALNFSQSTAAGTYTVRATTTSNAACTSLMSGSAVITISTLPSGSGTITGNPTACTGVSGVYKVSGILNATSYQWSVPAGIRIVSQAGPDANLLMESGTGGAVTVVGVNQCGNGGTAQISIQVSPTPAVEINLPASVAAGEDASFSYTSTSSAQTSTWNFGDNGTAAGNEVTHTFTDTGNYTVTVEITDTKGCKASDSQPLEVGTGKPGEETLDVKDTSIKNVVTANGDKKNDHLFIENIELYPGNTVVVIDRWGSEVFRTRGYNNDWDFRKNGDYMPAGNYVCIVRLHESGEVYKRTVTVIRGR